MLSSAAQNRGVWAGIGSPPGSRAPIRRKQPAIRSRYHAKSSPPRLGAPSGVRASAPRAASTARRAQATGSGRLLNNRDSRVSVEDDFRRRRPASRCRTWSGSTIRTSRSELPRNTRFVPR